MRNPTHISSPVSKLVERCDYTRSGTSHGVMKEEHIHTGMPALLVCLSANQSGPDDLSLRNPDWHPLADARV
jgi:hypothetical protein